MFETVFRPAGVFNQEAGKRYREKILAPGASKDATELLEDFLGRAPNEKAFIKNMGIK